MAFAHRQIMSILLFAVLLAVLPPLWGETASVDEHAAVLPPNAFTWYDKGGKMIDSDAHKQLARWKTLSRKEKRVLLARLSPALATVREGMDYPCRMPKIKKIEDKMPWFLTGRDVARLFALESDVLAADGHYAQATMSGLDAIHFGRDYSSGSLLIGRLVGIALQAIGRKSLWEYLPRLDSATARKAATRLAVISDYTTPYTEVLQEEKRFGMSVLQEFLDHPEVFRQTLEENAGKIDASDGLVRVIASPLIKDALQDYPKQMDAAIAMIESPYANWKTLPESDNLLTRILLIDFRKGGFRALENDAFNRLLYVSYALRAYQQEHGQFPETLSALCPEYLAAVPLDPFADAQPLKYSRTKTAYLLYSIGPDARDDAGKAIDDPKATAWPFQAKFDSTGDIVAGVNID